MIAPVFPEATNPKTRAFPRVGESSSAPSMDEFIRVAVERRLGATGYFPLRVVRCVVEDGVVFLYGNLPSFYMKQRAQAVALTLGFVMRVENHCEVEPHERAAA